MQTLTLTLGWAVKTEAEKHWCTFLSQMAAKRVKTCWVQSSWSAIGIICAPPISRSGLTNSHEEWRSHWVSVRGSSPVKEAPGVGKTWVSSLKPPKHTFLPTLNMVPSGDHLGWGKVLHDGPYVLLLSMSRMTKVSERPNKELLSQFLIT